MSQTGSFEFYDNYPDTVKKIQPELYHEIRKIMDNELNSFFTKYHRKPIILDIGSAGVLPYDQDLIENVVILDLFNKPPSLKLNNNCEWIVGDILSENLSPRLREYGGFDFIIMSSLLHHLCDENNNIVKNLEACFSRSARMLSRDGSICIFESTCSKNIAKIEDFIYPLYSKILKNLLRFTFVRMVSADEVLATLAKLGLCT